MPCLRLRRHVWSQTGMLTQVSMAPIVSKKRTPGLIPRGRDCHSRLGSIAMTGPVFLLYTGRVAAAGLAMTAIFMLTPFVAALGLQP